MINIQLTTNEVVFLYLMNILSKIKMINFGAAQLFIEYGRKGQWSNTHQCHTLQP
jgi:hypothetical protein